MSKCVICSMEAREKATSNGKPLCDICGAGSIPDWMIDDPWFSEERRKDLAAMLRSRYYRGLSTNLSGFQHADYLIQQYRDFEANAEGRDNLAVDALLAAGAGAGENDPDFLDAVSKAIGRSREESQEYIADLVKRGKIRAEWDRGRELPPGSKPFAQTCHWVKG